jgi:hypothetical protein
MQKYIFKIMYFYALFGIMFIAQPSSVLAYKSIPIEQDSISALFSSSEIIIQFKNNFEFDYQTWKKYQKSGNAILDSLNSTSQLSQIFHLFTSSNPFPDNNNKRDLNQIYLFRFQGKKSIQSLLKNYRELKFIRIVEPNYNYFCRRKGKNARSLQDRIQMKEAAEFIHNKKPVIIGIICTGLDWQRKDRIPALWRNPSETADGKDKNANGFIDASLGVDLTNLNSPEILKRSYLQDAAGFGTDLSSTIDLILNHPGEETDSGIHKLMILKAAAVSSKNEIIFNTFFLARAIVYAANNNANIVNISACGNYPSKILKHVIDYAYHKNCTIIAAAGESNSSKPVYPAAFENVISVAATDMNDRKTKNSNFGDWIDITAPGYLSDHVSDTVNTFLSETAIAAAQVTGLAGLLLTNEPNLNSDSLRKRIFFSSENIYKENADYHGKLGAGRINIFRALNGRQQPNIVVQKIRFQNSQQHQNINQGDTISVFLNLHNLSFDAKNVTIQLFSTSPNIQLINSEEFIPRLNFQAEYETKDKPLTLFINKKLSNEYHPEIDVNINVNNKFSFSNTYTIQPESAHIKKLPTPIDSAKYRQNPIEISFFPGADTIVTVGDNIQFFFKMNNNTNDSLKYLWFLNDSILTEATNSFNFHAPPDSEGTAKISTTIFSGDSSFLQKKEWIIKYLFKALAPNTFFYYPVSDTSVFEGDSLILSVASFSGKDSLRNFAWAVNNFSDTSNTKSSFVFTTGFLSSGTDTVSVSFNFSDSLFTHQWIINSMNNNRPPEIVTTIPSLDSILTKTDSILFKINCFDEDGDSLQYQWYRNNLIDTTATDSFYHYIIDDLENNTDSISVSVSDVDTSIFVQWFLYPDTTNSRQTNFRKSIYFYPETDSILAASDSLNFRISNLPDSTNIQWFVNSRIDSSGSDSSFIFNPLKREYSVDTLRVEIINRDSTLLNEWYIYYSELVTQKDSLKLTFLPEKELINFSTNDSLKFTIRLKNGNLSDINIHWFINHVLDESSRDTSFSVVPDIFSTTTDTISVLITRMDTTKLHNWAIRYKTVIRLPAPILQFPIAGERISEFETLIWKNDSSLTAFDSTSEWKYIVRLSRDSTFSEIFSTDTCTVSNLPLNGLNGFENITIGTPVYWNVILLSGENKESEFASSFLPFYYFPTFIVLEDFYGETKQDGIFLNWTTSYEENCAGFNIYRCESPDGNFEKINDYLITGKTNYSWIDKTTQETAVTFYKLEEITLNGRTLFHQPISVELPTPNSYSLSHNFPNPFNASTSFKYEIPKTTHVLIEVFNILGKKVKTLIDQRKDAGYYTVYWDGVDENGEGVVSGIYFYIISTEKFHATQKMIVVR